jgi:uncharacterized protein YcsI (UPF0317 family)
MQADECYNIFNTKIHTMQVKVVCLEAFVSSRPVNAGSIFIEAAQIGSRYDAAYLKFGIHFGAS